MKNKLRVIMAFDFGLKNIGIAIGQEITFTSQTFYSVSANNGEPILDELDKVVTNWKPDLFLVGNPLNMDGTISKIKTKSDKFSNFIEERYNIPVELVDERLSTREALDRISSKNKYLINNSDNRHSVAAQVILEHWFREQN